ncbi:MAG: hypothetical protein G01um101424_83 [Parcubacteria group bacterium Gr01-1014_24]|nr:MAG: hypothetical protein G01um101424_83 [Parcubacteria group bacterium Gr01-1014_24]
MLSLLVYLFRGNHYVILLGGSENFKTKEDVFLTGEETEVFTITHLPNTPFLETIRQLIAETDRRGIKDLRAMEVIFSGGQRKAAVDRPKSVN